MPVSHLSPTLLSVCVRRQSNPVLYTVFGFPITYGWLLTLGSGVLSTILLTTISTYVGA